MVGITAQEYQSLLSTDVRAQEIAGAIAPWQPRKWSFEDYHFINQWGPMGDVPGLLAISIPNVKERGQKTA
jgi:hypothetical protein